MNKTMIVLVIGFLGVNTHHRPPAHIWKECPRCGATLTDGGKYCPDCDWERDRTWSY